MLHTPTALDKACYSVRTFPSMTMANSRPFSPAAISASTYGQPAESTCSGDHTACHTTVTSSHPSPASAAAPPSHSFITLFITLLWRHPPHLHQLLLHPLVGQLVCFVHPPSLLQTVNSVGRYMDHWIRHTLGKHGTGGGGMFWQATFQPEGCFPGTVTVNQIRRQCQKNNPLRAAHSAATIFHPNTTTLPFTLPLTPPMLLSRGSRLSQ